MTRELRDEVESSDLMLHSKGAGGFWKSQLKQGTKQKRRECREEKPIFS